ncbi:GNAT family N-acetyltransferase [Streptomyces sp. TRM66268-LWL]|uniref:GNAT family N-acetyltransferase n=1 Tax=Streptomyces polyasparticus TaxID=2767826 RepID=A0ABR7S8Z3_9ACTN|nr:GNAT family N-acetyltransferase [Streptomyces polyasparticus]MBC9711888.1 GNAT family N-acetyltransferase [Streptomyces polyasparticus]
MFDHLPQPSQDVSLRPVHPSDLPVFFRQMNDPESMRTAAFVSPKSADWDLFQAHWERICAQYHVRAVLLDGDVVGSAAVFGEPGELEVTYWIDRAYWGRGVATAALRLLIAEVPERPLHARAAADNTGSVRVLEKCGFEVTGHDSGFAAARDAEVDEVVLQLA